MQARLTQVSVGCQRATDPADPVTVLATRV